MEQTKNYAYHSIAVAWALNLVPHTYFFLKAKSVAGNNYSNILFVSFPMNKPIASQSTARRLTGTLPTLLTRLPE